MHMSRVRCGRCLGKKKIDDWESIHNELKVNFIKGVRQFELRLEADVHELPLHVESIKEGIFDGLCIFAEQAKELGLENALSWTVDITIFGTDHSIKYSLARFLESYDKTTAYLTELQETSDLSKPITEAMDKVRNDAENGEDDYLGEKLRDYFKVLTGTHYCKTFIETTVKHLKREVSMASSLSWSETAQFSSFGTNFFKFRIETDIDTAQWISDMEHRAVTESQA